MNEPINDLKTNFWWYYLELFILHLLSTKWVKRARRFINRMPDKYAQSYSMHIMSDN